MSLISLSNVSVLVLSGAQKCAGAAKAVTSKLAIVASIGVAALMGCGGADTLTFDTTTTGSGGAGGASGTGGMSMTGGTGGVVTPPGCGDGAVVGEEACDDKNTAAGDGCSAACQIEHGYVCKDEPSVCTSTCGDGVVASNEPCDDGNTAAGDGCSDMCQIELGWSCDKQEPSVCAATCGDGVLDPTDECDDGDNNNGDGCSAACIVEHGYTCDGTPSVCTSTCGDGLQTDAEACDDGNNAPGDGCSETCTLEGGWSCFGEPSVCCRVTFSVTLAVGNPVSQQVQLLSGVVSNNTFVPNGVLVAPATMGTVEGVPANGAVSAVITGTQGVCAATMSLDVGGLPSGVTMIPGGEYCLTRSGGCGAFSMDVSAQVAEAGQCLASAKTATVMGGKLTCDDAAAGNGFHVVVKFQDNKACGQASAVAPKAEE